LQVLGDYFSDGEEPADRSNSEPPILTPPTLLQVLGDYFSDEEEPADRSNSEPPILTNMALLKDWRQTTMKKKRQILYIYNVCQQVLDCISQLWQHLINFVYG
jgi:hypothetical protein